MKANLEDSDPAAAGGRHLVRVAARGRRIGPGSQSNNSDNDSRHYSSNFTPIVNKVREVVLSLAARRLWPSTARCSGRRA